MVERCLGRIKVGKDFPVGLQLGGLACRLVELALQPRVGLEQLTEVRIVGDHLAENFGGDDRLQFQLKIFFFRRGSYLGWSLDLRAASSHRL